MGILALGILSGVGLMRWVVQGTAFNTQNTQATYYAQDKLEELAAGTYANAVSGSDSTQSMSRAWTVTTVGTYKTVEVSVKWTGVDNQTHSATMKSILSED